MTTRVTTRITHSVWHGQSGTRPAEITSCYTCTFTLVTYTLYKGYNGHDLPIIAHKHGVIPTN